GLDERAEAEQQEQQQELARPQRFSFTESDCTSSAAPHSTRLVGHHVRSVGSSSSWPRFASVQITPSASRQTPSTKLSTLKPDMTPVAPALQRAAQQRRAG